LVEEHLDLPVNRTLRFIEGGAPTVAVEPTGKAFVAWGRVKTELFQNFPNPFNPETWIPYQLASPSFVEIRIYAHDGRLIRRLDAGYQPAGQYRTKATAIYWDGRNTAGDSVASGLYFYELRADDSRLVRKMSLLK